MTEIEKFKFNANEVRVVTRDGEPWFVAKDVCEVLGTRVDNAVSGLDPDEYCTVGVIDSMGREQQNYGITEPGLYSLILRSRKPRAREFKRWVTHEVLPALRKSPELRETVDQVSSASAESIPGIEDVLRRNNELLKALGTENAELKPRALGAHVAEELKDGQPVWDLRYALSQQLGIGCNDIYSRLGMLGVLEQRRKHYYSIRPKWRDILFETPTVVRLSSGHENVYHNGPPRVRPGK